jgi:hypothetical protein
MQFEENEAVLLGRPRYTRELFADRAGTKPSGHGPSGALGQFEPGR